MVFAQSAIWLTRQIAKDYATIFGKKNLPPDFVTIIGGDKIKDYTDKDVLAALTRQPQLIAYYKHRNILAICLSQPFAAVGKNGDDPLRRYHWPFAMMRRAMMKRAGS